METSIEPGAPLLPEEVLDRGARHNLALERVQVVVDSDETEEEEDEERPVDSEQMEDDEESVADSASDIISSRSSDVMSTRSQSDTATGGEGSENNLLMLPANDPSNDRLPVTNGIVLQRQSSSADDSISDFRAKKFRQISPPDKNSESKEDSGGEDSEV